MSYPPQGPPPGQQPPQSGGYPPGDGYPPADSYPPADKYPSTGGYPPPAGYPQQPGYGGQQYGSPAYAPPPGYQPQRSSNGLAIAALILGILALLSCWTVVGGIVFGLVAIVLGLFGVRRSRTTNSGSGMAIGGVILGVLGLLAAVALIVFGVSMFNKVGGGDYVSCVNDANGDQSALQQCADEFQQNLEDKFGTVVVPT